MTDFPPNLEDGEKWLPSDLYQEIMSKEFKNEALVDDPAKECVDRVLDEPIKSAFKSSSNVNEVDIAGNGVSKIVRSSGGVSYYNPIAPTQTQVGISEHGAARSSVVGMSGRTGVFLPCAANENKPLQETDVAPASDCVMENSWKDGKEVGGMEKSCPVSTEICLPEEWTY